MTTPILDTDILDKFAENEYFLVYRDLCLPLTHQDNLYYAGLFELEAKPENIMRDNNSGEPVLYLEEVVVLYTVRDIAWVKLKEPVGSVAMGGYNNNPQKPLPILASFPLPKEFTLENSIDRAITHLLSLEQSKNQFLKLLNPLVLKNRIFGFVDEKVSRSQPLRTTKGTLRHMINTVDFMFDYKGLEYISVMNAKKQLERSVPKFPKENMPAKKPMKVVNKL